MDDRQLISDLLSALEYHTEQTRPIDFSRVAIEAAHEYLRKSVHTPPQPAQQQEPAGTVQCINGVTIGYLDVMQPVGTKLYTKDQL